MGHCFGVPDAPRLTTVPLKQARFSVTRLRCAVEDTVNVPVYIPAQDAYFVMLYLRDVFHCDIRADQSRTDIRLYQQNSICLVDLAEGAAIALHSSLDSLAFLLPKTLLQEVTEIYSASQPGELKCLRGNPDAVMGSLGTALVSLMDISVDAPPATLRHIATAVCAHILQDYSEICLRNSQLETSLSVWQEKVAKAFIVDNLGSNVSVARIAEVTGFSPGHFAQEFRKTTGLTPHQWLTHTRIDLAKRLISERGLALQAIGDRCGFTDQSHFTKVFVRQTGMTPKAWRNAMLH